MPLVGLLALLFYLVGYLTAPAEQTWTYSQLLNQAAAGKVRTVDIRGDSAAATSSDRTDLSRAATPEWGRRSLPGAQLYKDHVSVAYHSPSGASTWLPVALTLIPLLLIGGFMDLLVRKSRGANQIMLVGRSGARQISPDEPRITFTDAPG